VHLVGFYYKNISRCTVLRMSMLHAHISFIYCRRCIYDLSNLQCRQIKTVLSSLSIVAEWYDKMEVT